MSGCSYQVLFPSNIKIIKVKIYKGPYLHRVNPNLLATKSRHACCNLRLVCICIRFGFGSDKIGSWVVWYKPCLVSGQIQLHYWIAALPSTLDTRQSLKNTWLIRSCLFVARVQSGFDRVEFFWLWVMVFRVGSILGQKSWSVVLTQSLDYCGLKNQSVSAHLNQSVAFFLNGSGPIDQFQRPGRVQCTHNLELWSLATCMELK